MKDIDAELAALEAEVENEAKAEIKKSEQNQSSYTNKNQNYGNYKPQNQPKKTNVNIANNYYNGSGNDETGLEDFLNSDDTNVQGNNNNNYQNKNKYNQYSNYSNSNNNNNYGNYNNSNSNRANNNYYNNNNYNSNHHHNQQKNNAQNNFQNNPKNAPKNPNQYDYSSHQTQIRPKPQNQNKPIIDQKNSYKTQVVSKSREQKQESKEDIYPAKQENLYHKLKEMKSITVIEEEIALCDKIIGFKKNLGLDYDNWESKKDLAEMQLNNTKSLVESGKMDFEAYKKLIKSELAYEKKILKYTESDKISKPYELAEIRRRIEQRIKVINDELSQNIDEEERNEEPKKQENKSNINNSGNKTTINPKTALAKNIPQDSEPKEKSSTQTFTNNDNKKNKINPNPNLNQIPKQYII